MLAALALTLGGCITNDTDRDPSVDTETTGGADTFADETTAAPPTTGTNTTDPPPPTTTSDPDTTSNPVTTTSTDDTTGPGTTGGTSAACDPDNADFTGEVITQAGVAIDCDALTCVTLSGLPPDDQLVVDDFGDGTFGGSGSDGLTVVSVTGGDFTNDEGFYVLSNLDVGSPVSVELRKRDGTTFTVTFTIVAGDPARLTDVSVEFS